MKALIVLGCMFYTSLLLSQNTFSAKILEKATNQPVAYATVMVKNSNLGTYSDTLGIFSLHNVKKGDTILISAMGYKTKPLINLEQVEDLIVLEREDIRLAPVVIQNHNGKGRWKKTFERNKLEGLMIHAVLFEGTTIRRFVTNIEGQIIGLKYYLVRPTADLTIVLRPMITDAEGNSLLYQDYTQTFQLKRHKNQTITFEFNEAVTLPKSGAYLGIETVSAPNNNNYEKLVQIECSADEDVKTDVKSLVNHKQESGRIFDFDKTLPNNLYMKVKIAR